MRIDKLKLRVHEDAWSVKIKYGEGIIATIPYGATYPIRDHAQAKCLADKLVKAFNDSQKGK